MYEDFNMCRLYLNGVQMRVDRLYPSVEFPVSPHTPSLSPFVKWDHSQDWMLPSFDAEKAEFSRERKFTIDTTYEDLNFITGHCIDGERFFF